MNKWKILGIDKTKDKQMIKDAYRSRLVHVNPEDDAEGFMRLRKAYEDALIEADAAGEPEAEPVESGLLYEITSLYKDFKRRIDVEEWRSLFAREEFTGLDTADASMYELLTFLMGHNCLPRKVFKLIVDEFRIGEIKGRLVERYPEGFIKHILNNARYRDCVHYERFETVGDDIDEFIDLYYRLDNALERRSIEEEEKYIDAIEQLETSHPYVEICKLYHALHRINVAVSSQAERAEKYAGELWKLQVRAEAVLEQCGEDIFILLACGDLALARQDYDQAGKYYGMAQAVKPVIEPDEYVVKGRMGDFYYATGEYEKSRDVFLELLDINTYDVGAHAGMVRANNGLMEKLKKEISEHPEDESLKLQLVWCCYRNGLVKEAIDVLEAFEPSAGNRCEYYNLLGRSYLYIGEYQKAKEYFLTWKNEIEETPEQVEDNPKAKNPFGRVNYFIGECCIGMKEYDEARSYLEAAMSKEHDFTGYACEAMCKLEYECGNYGACVSACEKLAERDDGSYTAYLYMAKSFDGLGQYSLALDACEHAIAVYRYASEPYVLELEIYWAFDEFDEMRRVLAQFDETGCKSDRVDIYRAKLLASEEDYAASNEMMLALLDKRGTEDTDLEDYYDVYTLLGSNYEDMEEDGQALHYYMEALKDAPEDRGLLNRIAGLYHVTGEFERAIAYYDRVLARADGEKYRILAYTGKAAALSCMKRFYEAEKVYESCEEEFGLDDDYVLDHAELLVRMDNLAGCVRLMEKCIRELGDSPLVQYCIGNLCCFYGNEGYIEEAHRCLEMMLERYEDDYLIYRSMGLIYLEHGMYEKAVEMFHKNLELDMEHRSFVYGPYLLAVGKIDDITKPEYQKYIDTAKTLLADSGDSFSFESRAKFYRSIKEYEEALRYIDMAINERRGRMSCFVESPFAWSDKGDIYADMGEYQKAVECYEKALELFGHHALFEDCIQRYREMV